MVFIPRPGNILEKLVRETPPPPLFDTLLLVYVKNATFHTHLVLQALHVGSLARFFSLDTVGAEMATVIG
jgi:hypothetical protein